MITKSAYDNKKNSINIHNLTDDELALAGTIITR